MFKLGFENIAYCDSDSIVCNPEMGNNLNLGEKIGQWKFEHEFDCFYSFAPKNYIFYEQGWVKSKKGKQTYLNYEEGWFMKCKGLNRTYMGKSLDIINNEFKCLLDFGTLDRVKIITELEKKGYSGVFQYMNLKESLKNQNEALSVKEIKKKYSLLDTKRIWNENQSVPLILE